MAVEGTTENVAGSTTGGVTSGTASEAMVKAATAASSAASLDAGGGPPAHPATETGTPAGGQPPATLGTPAAGTTGTPGGGAAQTIELARHKDILQKSRAWEASFKEAGLDPAKDLAAAVKLLSQLRKDSKAFHSQLGQELGGGGEAEVPTELPPPDLLSQDGKTGTWSHTAMLKVVDIVKQQIRAEFKQQIGPLAEYHGQQLESQRVADVQKRVDAAGKRILEQTAKLPHFEELKPAISTRLGEMAEADPELVAEIGPGAMLMLAYNSVLAEKSPSLSVTAEEKVREEFKKKANAGGIHPAGGGGAEVKPVSLRNPADLSKHMEKLAETMANS